MLSFDDYRLLRDLGIPLSGYVAARLSLVGLTGPVLLGGAAGALGLGLLGWTATQIARSVNKNKEFCARIDAIDATCDAINAKLDAVLRS